MSFLTDLGVIDIRDQLPRATWTIGQRSATTSATWHYNGPAVPIERQHGAGLIAQLRADAEWQMRPSWGGTKDGAPHLMYHFVFDPFGAIYQTADLLEVLWHCAHQDGNARGVALHFPLGTGQGPTPAQLAAAIRFTNALHAQFGISRSRIVGHLEWKHATACPGPALMAQVLAYRAGRTPQIQPTATPAGLRRFQISPSLTAPARVRQAPRTHWDDGREVTVAGRLKPGTVIFADADPEYGFRIPGKVVEGNPYWVHMARVPHEQADLGFISETLGVWLS